jgi:hypothetical protein
MKMNKFFAAGIAATLAVTSLAATASAETTREYILTATSGVLTYAPTALGGNGYDLGKEFAYAKDDKGEVINYSINGDTIGDDTLGTYDYYVPFWANSENAKLVNAVSKISVVINGKGFASDGATTTNLTQTASLINIKDAKNNPTNEWRLPIYAEGGPIGSFIPERFVQIDSISLKVETNDTKITLTDVGEKDYKAIVAQKTNTDNSGKWSVGLAIDADGDLVPSVNGVIPTQWELKAWGNGNGGSLWLWPGALTSVATGAAVAQDATKTNSNGVKLVSKIIELMQKDNNNGITFALTDYKTIDRPAWLPRTANNDDGILDRWEIDRLSDTNDYMSGGLWGSADTNQTYKYDETYLYNKGTVPVGFAGLASQIADFFNKQTNGKIYFYFGVPAKAAQDAGINWTTGGIPSTEVGVKTIISQSSVTAKDFALFINYQATTGSLQALAAVDAEKDAVVFDISDILEALGGQTIGTVSDVYYGLNKGLAYKDANGAEINGLYITKVVLAYDEAKKADTAAAAATDDKADETVKEEAPAKEEPKADDKAEEIEIKDEPEDLIDNVEEPDDATVVIEEPDDATAVVDNTADNAVVVNPTNDNTVVVTPVNTAAADENPHTGAALAVIPAALAAAAMVISKKRK